MHWQSVNLAQIVLESHAVLAAYAASSETDACDMCQPEPFGGLILLLPHAGAK